MLRQIHAVDRNFETLSDDRIDDRKKQRITFFTFENVIDVGILRSVIVGSVSATIVYIKKNMIDDLYFFERSQIVVQFKPNILSDLIDLFADLGRIDIRVLVPCNKESSFEEILMIRLGPIF